MGENQSQKTPSPMLLHDGRRIDYLEVGTSSGFPIFHFHGNGWIGLMTSQR